MAEKGDVAKHVDVDSCFVNYARLVAVGRGGGMATGRERAPAAVCFHCLASCSCAAAFDAEPLVTLPIHKQITAGCATAVCVESAAA